MAVTYRVTKGSPLTHAEFDANMEAVDDAVVLLGTAEESLADIRSIINFAGIWTELSGSLDKPATVSHKDSFWILLNDIPDVTTSEPTDSNTDWLQVRITIFNSTVTLAEAQAVALCF